LFFIISGVKLTVLLNQVVWSQIPLFHHLKEVPMKRRALVSVTDKRELDKLKVLTDNGWEIVSTGGTAKKLEELGIPFTPIEAVTGFPEMMDGRLKTLHPNIFGGILADRSKPEHMTAIKERGIVPIDLVVVNLYDFESKPSIEQIDIGGPSLLRAAAKNFESVVVLIDPDDYEWTFKILTTGEVSYDSRRSFAWRVFQEVSAYDHSISRWFIH